MVCPGTGSTLSQGWASANLIRRGQAPALLYLMFLQWKRVRNSGKALTWASLLGDVWGTSHAGTLDQTHIDPATLFHIEDSPMRTWMATATSLGCRIRKTAASVAALILTTSSMALAQPARDTAGGEAGLTLPDLSQVTFLGRIDGHKLLLVGLLFCVFGLLFGLTIYTKLKNLPVHRAMLEISELIYETCKTYLVTQGKFILILWAFIALIIALYFGWLAPVPGKSIGVTLPIILMFSLVGIEAATGWRGSASV